MYLFGSVSSWHDAVSRFSSCSGFLRAFERFVEPARVKRAREVHDVSEFEADNRGGNLVGQLEPVAQVVLAEAIVATTCKDKAVAGAFTYLVDPVADTALAAFPKAAGVLRRR